MEFIKRTIQTHHGDFVLQEMTHGQAERIFGDKQASVADKNRRMVVQCLNNADGGSRTAEEVENWPFSLWKALFQPCLELNGFSLEVGRPGETRAAES